MSDEIAIIGVGCRFPGGANPEAWWDFLMSGGDAVRPLPPGRWSEGAMDPDPQVPGRSYAAQAGFLDDPALSFDAAFFGISPREAETLDPQQRLLLEVAWEALEQAGVPLEEARRQRAGVYVGGFTLDSMILRFQDLEQVDSFTATSSSMTLLSNRISYALDLGGPSLTVDTACSSSLVAVHLAAQALRAGDCGLALAGGVNLMLLPNFPVVMCKGRFLAADGRSKTFDAAADGYGRGEGAGLVLLKRLDRALADGDRVIAVLAGSGVNQDGATDGIAQPSAEAQEALIRRVVAGSGVDPRRLGMVEAHGTGTALGDPIELSALGAVYGRPGPGAPRVASVKAQIGHLEAAAGVAGLIKAALAVQRRQIPPHRRPERLNPALRLEERGLRLPDSAEPWPLEDDAFAAVNSFGYGGTNAHALLRQPPAQARPCGGPRAQLLPISARCAGALRERAAQVAAALEAGAEPEALCSTLAWRRSPLSHRLALPVSDPAELAPALRRWLAQEGASPAPSRRALWVYSGMGAQYAGMGRGLLRRPAFRRGWEEAIAALRLAGLDLGPELGLPVELSAMARNDVAQPCNFALQVGLTAELRAAGLEPAAIVGHSTGEMAAAWAAGCLSLEEAALVVACRSRLQQEVAGGGMLAVGLGEGELAAWLQGLPVELAAVNSAGSCTLAGPREALSALRLRLEAEGRYARELRVEVAYHSAAMEPIEARLQEALRGLCPQAPRCPLYSTVSGGRVAGPFHGGDYWWRNTRGVVRLQAALGAALSAQELDCAIQIGPHPVLGPSLQEAGLPAVFALMLRGQPQEPALLGALAGLWQGGAELDWSGLVPRRALVDLPPYPWQRRRHWRAPALAAQDHPLIEVRERGGGWWGRIDGSRWAWLRDHRVGGLPIAPGALWVEALLLGAGAPVVGQRRVLGELRFHAALALSAPGEVQRLELRPQGPGLELRAEGAGAPLLLATACPQEGARWGAPEVEPLALLRQRCAEEVDVAALYGELSARGLDYGPAFQGLHRLWRGSGEVLALLSPAPEAGLLLPPSRLDAALQALLALAPGDERTLLPISIERLQWEGQSPAGPWWVHGRGEADGELLRGDLELMDEAGRPFARLRGLCCRALPLAEPEDGLWHRMEWAELAPAAPRPGEVWRAPQGEGEGPVLALLEHLRARPAGAPPLLVVTRGAWACPAHPGGRPDQAALWGLGRVVMAEAPERGLRLLDLGPEQEDPGDESLLAAISDEEEVSLSGGRRWARRMRAVGPEAPEEPGQACAAGERPMRLVAARPGSLDGLVWEQALEPAPGPGQVEVEIEAVSLNFKDVMKALGLLDGAALEQSYLGQGLGMEAVGWLRRAGPGLDLAPGQRLLVYAGDCLRRRALVDARFTLPCPEGWSAEQAASFFVTVTAWHALVDVGRLRPGETALIHSAAGGVGLAAVGIARARGARVIATAGTEEKRRYLRGLGLEHVLDSRRLDFGEQARALTGGRGVDLVLNALAGPAIEEGLRCLAPGGRFLELGKKDLRAARWLGLGAFNRRLSFAAIDLDRAATEDPGYFGPLARAVAAELEAGRLPFLPARRYPAEQAGAAFRALSSGELVGKVLIDVRQGQLRLQQPQSDQLRADPQRSYLITGGCSGFGLCLAEALVQAGARHLWLVSRSGRPRPEELPRLRSLERRASLRLRAVDVGDGAQVEALIAEIQGSGCPLGGLVHAATAYADSPLPDLDEARLREAWRAKAEGARWLHEATAGLDLQLFALCSSISAQVGNPGQAAYAAANGYLEGLVELRRAQGLPATALALGALGGAGLLSRDRATAAHLEGLGLRPIPARLAARALLQAAARGQGLVSLVDISWSRWAGAHPRAPWSRLSELSGPSSAGPARLSERLLRLPPEQRLAEAERALAAVIGGVLRMEPGAIEARRPLRELGLDSLIAVELATALRHREGVEASAMELLAGRSLRSLAEASLPALAPADRLPERLGPEQLRGLICVTAPYEALSGLRVEGERLLAEVEPVRLPPGPDEPEVPVGAAELGRHLAILGSLALAASRPQAGRRAYPVLSAEMELEPLRGPPLARVRASARPRSWDEARGEAEAEGELQGLDGLLLGRLRVRYHVLPWEGLHQLYAERAAPTPPGPDPYQDPLPIERLADRGQGWEWRLPPVPAEACRGHFDGLPALPVSILGRAVFAAVAGAHRDLRPGPLPLLRRARLRAHRFIWAGEEARLRVREAEGWRCEIRVGEELAADFRLEFWSAEAG